MAPPFRRPIPDTVKNVLGSRSGLYSKGNTVDYFKPKTRNTAFCTIKKQGITVSTLEDTFNETYNPNSLKPRPNLIRAEIERIGNDASLVNLSMRIRGTIEVYTMSDFIRYSEVFCINDPKNQLSITMGYAAPFDGCPSYTVKGCFIAYGTWHTTNENYYQLSFEAIGPGEVFSTMDIGLSGLWERSDLKYQNNKSFNNDVEEGQVSGYYELMLYDAQKSGATLTDSIGDGEIIPYSRKNNYEGKVQFGIKYLNFRGGITKSDIVVYQPIEGNELSPDPTEIPTAQTTTDEFYTLQYVVDRIINEFALEPFYRNGCVPDSKVKDVFIGFPEKPRCSSLYGSIVRSCDPKKILILGGQAGNYTNKNNRSEGKNYETLTGGSIDGIKSHYASYIDYRKILIHRNTVYDAIKSTMHTTRKGDPGNNIKNDFIDEAYLRVDMFLKNLFTVISQCTGGFVQLTLVQDDGGQDNDNLSEHRVLRIVPATFVNEDFNVWQFDTINGDGSTRELNISAELPSTDLHASLVKTIFNTSRTAHAVSEGNFSDGFETGQDAIRNIAKKLMDNYYNDLMPRTKYSEETCDGARNLLATCLRAQSTDSLISNNQYLWLMKMNVKMDGVGGWRIGHHINSNTVPTSFTVGRNIAFVITRVHHVVEGQDWQTELESICTAIPSGTSILGGGGGTGGSGGLVSGGNVTKSKSPKAFLNTQFIGQPGRPNNFVTNPFKLPELPNPPKPPKLP